jgi:hypothetical protein
VGAERRGFPDVKPSLPKEAVVNGFLCTTCMMVEIKKCGATFAFFSLVLVCFFSGTDYGLLAFPVNWLPRGEAVQLCRVLIVRIERTLKMLFRVACIELLLIHASFLHQDLSEDDTNEQFLPSSISSHHLSYQS